MNPFFIFQMLGNLVRGKKKPTPKCTPDYTKSKYYRGQDYDDHVYDRGEDCGLDDCGEDKPKKRKDSSKS